MFTNISLKIVIHNCHILGKIYIDAGKCRGTPTRWSLTNSGGIPASTQPLLDSYADTVALTVIVSFLTY